MKVNKEDAVKFLEKFDSYSMEYIRPFKSDVYTFTLILPHMIFIIEEVTRSEVEEVLVNERLERNEGDVSIKIDYSDMRLAELDECVNFNKEAIILEYWDSLEYLIE